MEKNTTNIADDEQRAYVRNFAKKRAMKYFIALFLFLSACNSDLVRSREKPPRNHEIYSYALQPIDLKEITDTELAGKTFAEVENERYREKYERKMYELKRVFGLFVEFYRTNFKNDRTTQDRIKTIQKQEQDFENFIKSYAEKNASLYLRSVPYNYYGSLIDMIDLRIKHLKIHMEQFL
jgi:hypothetical protein